MKAVADSGVDGEGGGGGMIMMVMLSWGVEK